MREIAEVYSKLAFRLYTEWREENQENLRQRHHNLLTSYWRSEKSSEIADDAIKNPWKVNCYSELVDKVSFLNSVNYRWMLFFRGQNNAEHAPKPRILRDRWRCLDEDPSISINDDNRIQYWKYLNDELGPEVADICSMDEGTPNYWHIRNVREAQWAVIQHYGLWPTPLIDLTLNLRVAASFAFHGNDSEKDNSVGYVFVVGMPGASGSITHDPIERIVLTRLQSACPPVALRPHYQEGYLVGHYPLYDMKPRHLGELSSECNLNRRLVAVFELNNEHGKFWTPDFPKVERKALYPPAGREAGKDRILQRFKEKFGADGQPPLREVAMKFAGALAG